MTDHVKNTCKIGRGNSCCRYLVGGIHGFECAKKTEHKKTLDFRVALGTIVARGDNCEGYSSKESIKLLNNHDEKRETAS